MRGVLTWLLACAIFGTALTLTRQARAEDEAVFVVDVRERASDLDPDLLLALIAQELRAHVVTPADPRASAAKGTVDVDRVRGERSATYEARVTPTTRHIPLPTDVASARRSAALLAGNLARDEASELAAELRKQPPAVRSSAPARAAEAGHDETRQRARAARAVSLHGRPPGPLRRPRSGRRAARLGRVPGRASGWPVRHRGALQPRHHPRAPRQARRSPRRPCSVRGRDLRRIPQGRGPRAPRRVGDGGRRPPRALRRPTPRRLRSGRTHPALSPPRRGIVPDRPSR